MADERWAQVSKIYNDAVALAPVDRAAFLRKACGTDEALRAEIESLLGDDSRVNTLLEPKGSHTARIGQRIGSYEIRSLLGVGGMGEVYRARDSKLDRDVAIKVLPVAVASDAERLARFQREARLLASLNHPHIGGIYGFEDASDVPALVLELVEGDTLADRLVIVQSFPDPLKGRHQISSKGGSDPRWSRDGRELFYIDSVQMLIAVSVSTDGPFKVQQTRELFTVPSPQYDVAPRAERFLFNVSSTAVANPPPINLVLNWTTGLK